MKKIILFGFILLLATQNIFAQISGVKTIPGDYPSITQALMQIQTVGISGPVFLELQNGYSSSGETFPIKIREYAGSAAYPLTISPAIDATDLSIFSTSSHSIIEFIGAYNVTIDGRPGRTGIERELSIRGLSTDNKVISFLDGAVSNTVTYCDVLSSVITSSEFDPDKNVVFFGRSTEPVPVGILLENSNNTLSDCNVVAFTSAYSVIYAKSISSDVINAGNNIINNEIRNFYSSGIQIGMNGGSNWNITGNSIYNLNSNISTGQYGIAFDPGATSVNNTISGNYIGGRASLAQGNPMISKGIFAIYVASASSVIIENNTIKNIRLEDNIGDPLLIGINIQGNTSAQIRSNHIGGSSEEDGIVMYGSNLNENQFIGIGAGGCFPVSIENNRISNITMQSTGPQVFIGIGYKEGANTTITGNQIDQVTATSTGNIVFSAISAFSPGGCPVPPQPAVFDQNLVHNITLSSDNDDASFTGIDITGTGSVLQLHNNQLYRIIISSPGGAASFTGLKVNDRISANTGNIIGSATEANSIMVSGQSASANGIVLNNSPDVSVSDDIIANITAIGTATPASVYGIVFNNGAIAKISGNQVHHLTANQTAGILIRPSNGSSGVTLEKNILTGLNNNTGTGIETFVSAAASLNLVATGNTVSNWQTGVLLEAQTGATLQQSFQSNSVIDNQTGFINNNVTPVNATCNWWGHASGPSGAGPGTGNPVGPNVIFSPWATSSNYVSVNAGNDQTIYAGYGPSSKTLTPTYTVCGAPNYLWSTGATTPSITVSPITTTVYSITVTDANGHQATDQVTVVVKDFRCGNQNSKILICHKGPNGKRTTLCVSPIVAIVHVLLGGELGACPSATASTGAAMKSGDDENLSKEENKEPLTLKLYPNPTDNQLQLQWKAEAPGQTIINVLDMHGRTVFTQTVMQTKGNNNRQILLPKLANGNYILMMQTGVGIKSVRFIVQH